MGEFDRRRAALGGLAEPYLGRDGGADRRVRTRAVMTSLTRATYQFTAAACADLVSRVPALEPALVRVGSHVWNWRHAGRFYRSVAGRYADRLRQSGWPFRRV
jgi:hypothetical protein